MALNTTRSLTGQEVIVLAGDKDNSLTDLDTPANLNWGTDGNISSWLSTCTPNITQPTEARTPLGQGANAVTQTQPTGLLSVSFSMAILVNVDALNAFNEAIFENRLSQYLYPIQVILGTAASGNQFYRAYGHYTELSPTASSESLVAATTTFMATHNVTQGLTTGMLN